MGFFEKFFGARPASTGPRKRRWSRVHIERRFTLHGRLGQGSMSKVWRATDNLNGRTVCLKVLDRAKTELLKKRFIGMKRPDEGEVAMQLVHPNIVRTFEHGYTTKNEEYIAMELIEGVGMNFLFDTRPKQWLEHGLELLIQTGEAVAFFHEKGFIHRDVCPRNVMVTADHVAKLIDFGLAVPNTPEFRRPGNRTGTASYMAPELIKRSYTDQRIDVFSFGVTVYEAYTGGHPWEQVVQSIQSMLNHINSPARDPLELNPRLDPQVVRVLNKGVERDPDKRYQTMRAFIDDLKMLQEKKLVPGKLGSR